MEATTTNMAEGMVMVRDVGMAEAGINMIPASTPSLEGVETLRMSKA